MGPVCLTAKTWNAEMMVVGDLVGHVPTAMDVIWGRAWKSVFLIASTRNAERTDVAAGVDFVWSGKSANRTSPVRKRDVNPIAWAKSVVQMAVGGVVASVEPTARV